jgi:hypothetical protein
MGGIFQKRGAVILTASLAMTFFMAFSLVARVSAHETVTIGAYEVEYGWLNEPAVTGQPNAVVLNLSLTGASAPADVDVSGLKVEAVFGSESKVLSLQPLGEDTPGQFVAPITPMRPGTYTIHLSGSIGASEFDNDVTPEEVQTADLVQFPLPPAAAAPVKTPLGLAGWLGIAGIVLGLSGVVIGLVALFRRIINE